jgi:hypothetical protein
MVRVTCPHCSSTLNAKDELIGHVRKCPKCGQPVTIVADPPAVPQSVAVEAVPESVPIEQAPLPEGEHAIVVEGLPSRRLPERLDRHSHYLIVDRTSLVATWQSDGHGWMMKVGVNYIAAKRNRQNLPVEGDFKLVELLFDATPEGRRLSGVIAFQLATRWALTALGEGDDKIVSKIKKFGALNREQKFAVRQVLKEQFMPEVWEKSAEVLEYLANLDYHSPGVGMDRTGPPEMPHLNMVDFAGAMVYVDSRPPRGLDFGFHVFQTFNPKAAESIAERQASGGALVTVENLGSFGLTDTGFLQHARELAGEDPKRSLEKSVTVIQENSLTVEAAESGTKYHTVMFSYFRCRDAKEVMLPAGESLDSLLQ